MVEPMKEPVMMLSVAGRVELVNEEFNKVEDNEEEEEELPLTNGNRLTGELRDEFEDEFCRRSRNKSMFREAFL